MHRLLLVVFLMATGLVSAYASTITVTNGNNSGTGSLRTAITNSVAGDVIVFSGVSTVSLTSAELLIDHTLTIDGGGGVTITRTGSNQFRLFNIQGGSVSFIKLAVTNGDPGNDGAGALYLNTGATLTMTNCVFTGNTATIGGAIYVNGTLHCTDCAFISNTCTAVIGSAIAAFPPAAVTMTGCTVSGNSGGANGAAIDFRGQSNIPTSFSATNCTISGNNRSGYIAPDVFHSATLTNCTITDNEFGIRNSSATVVLKNTIVADNFADLSGTNISASSSFNLIGTGGAGGLTNGVNGNQVGVANPGLQPLASNGGFTQTHALGNCSPAINTGTNSGAPSTDQRGSPRPFGGTSDVGAYERQSASSGISITSSVDDANCYGENSGSITLTMISGATPPLTYAWSGTGSGTNPRTNLGAGTYTVTVTDANGCTATASATVGQPPALVMTADITNVSCNGGNNGAITLNVTGGTPGYTYIWSGLGIATNTRTNLFAGPYTVTVVDNHGCGLTLTHIVSQPAAIVVTPTVTNASCNASNGSINLAVSGGASGYTYAWTGTGTGNNPRTNLAAGMYMVTVTDANNCTKTSSSTVGTAADVTLPTITCPASQNLSANSSCVATLPDYTGLASAADNCTANPTVTQSPASGTSFNAGPHTVTMTATDASSNTRTCTFTVTVLDQTAPSISCPANTTVAAGAACTATLASYTAAATATDNCTANPTKTQSPVAGTTFTGSQAVTLMATDASSNTGTCMFTVTVTDQTAPSINCPSNTTVAASATCTASLPAYTAAATAADNCTANPTKTQSPLAGTTITGIQVVTLSATDGAGNTGTCTFTVTVTDQTAPTITCPANTTVAAGGNCMAILGSFTASATATDNCTANPTKTQSPVSGISFNTGPHAVTLTATDASNNTGTCSFTVTVTDQTPPTVTCPANTTFTADINGNFTLGTYFAAAIATDNCTAFPTRTQMPAAGTVVMVGQTVVTITATDAAGNSATCNFTLTIQPGCAPPTVSCPANVTVTAGANCTASLLNYTAGGTINGGCGTSSLSQSPVAGTTLNLGPQTVTLTATDGNNSTGTCAFTVTVVDQTGPSITCPANISMNNTSGQCAATVTFTAPVGTDNCSGSVTTQTAGLAAGAAFPVGTTTNTFRVTDGAANTATCAFTVTVSDTQLPTISCPANISMNNTTGQCAATVTFTAPVGTDNCSGAVTTQTTGLASGATFPVGTTTNTFRVTDGVGNTATCAFTVTVSDGQLPTITCPANTTVTAGIACSATLISYTAATTATDNCTSNPSKTQSPVSGTTITGTQVVVLTATDAAGNSANCSFSVTVVDQTAPTITCPANTTVAAGANCMATLASYTTAATATDNCTASPNKTQSPTAGTSITGTQVIVLTATDAAGNSANCSFSVTVVDQTVPTITCPANTTVAAGANCMATLASYTTAATATDNCTASPSKTQSPVAGTSISGTQLVVLTATDAAGNSANCSFSVTVADQTVPTITCPANATVAAGANCMATLASYTAAATATDNCTASPSKTQSPVSGNTISGTQVVVLTATDAAGNSANCSFSVTVADQTVPTITCPANATVAAGTNCMATLASYTAAATAADNCTASPSKTQSPVSGNTISGTQVVVLTATDAAGNSANCSFSVTVADQTAPTITCPTNTTVAAGANCMATLASYTTAATATDNCTASPSKTQSPAAGTSITGTQVVVLTATDAASNSANCSFSVTVADQTVPTITCPANATVAAGANCVATLASYTAAATAADNCTASPSKTQSPVSGNTISGTQVVVLTATDAAGNSANCSFSVTVVDQTAPTITCPTNTTVAASANCMATLASYTTAATATDNCTASPSKTQSPAAGTSITGTQVVVLTATDAASNSANCSFSVTVADQTVPTITCPANATVAAGANCVATLASYTAAATATDNCTASPGKTQSPASGATISGSQVVTLTATDASNNSGTCTFTVTVTDQTVPTITCPANATVTAGANCSAALANYAAAATATDNCTASPTKTQSPAAGTAQGLGTQVVTLTATDAASNSANCSFSVTVVDQTPPAMICNNVTLTLPAAGNATLTVAQVNNGSFDNCGINVFNLSRTTFTCANIGANSVSLTGVDLSNNTGACTSIVTVVDASVPTVSCKNLTVNLGSNGSVTVLPAQINNGSSDNCSFTTSLTPGTFNCANVGTNTVVFKATDGSGNTATCTAIVTVRDASGPTAMCKNINVFLDSNGHATITASQVNNGSSDNCTLASMSINNDQFDCGQIGGSPVVVNLLVRDAYNNQSSCISYVTVKDAIAPEAICQDMTVQLNAQGRVTVSGATLAANSHDNCSVWAYTPVAKIYTCANLGPNNLTVTVRDYSGNAATCVSTITVLAPVNGCGSVGLVTNDGENTGPLTAEAIDLRVYPNPTSGATNLAFQLPVDQYFDLRLFDLSGRLVLNRKIQGVEGENNLQLDLGEVASGMYIVDFQSENLKAQRRVVVQK